MSIIFHLNGLIFKSGFFILKLPAFIRGRFAMKKLILAFLFVVVGTVIFTANAAAQTPFPATPSAPQSLPLNTNPDVPQNMNTYTQSVFINMLATATCFVAGYDPLSVDGKCLGIDPETKKIGYVESGNGGLLALAGNMIGSTYNIPVSSVEYGRTVAANFGITKDTHAQTPEEICADLPPEAQAQCLDHQRTGLGEGKGFASLAPLLDIWTMFRNIIYLFFVLVFVVLGLGIMFRVNIDARTVMTIQNQIPRVIIALILITLSYAIAGFLIDIMYVTMHLTINLMASQGLDVGTRVATNPFHAFGGLGSVGSIAGDAAGSVGGIISNLFEGTIGTIVQTMVTTIVGTLVGTTVGGLPGGLIGGAIGGIIGVFLGDQIVSWVASIIAFLIIAIAILSVLFRVWFILIKAYIFIILDIVLAPLWIVGGVLPGGRGGFGPWFRSLLSNLAAFPLVLFLFSIGRLIQQNFENPANAGGFVPPFIGDRDPGDMSAFASLIGLGFILIMPEALNIAKQTLNAPDFKIAGAAGRAIGTGTEVVGSPFKATWKQLTEVRRDGSRGPLAAFATDLGTVVGRKIATRTGLSRIPGVRWMNRVRDASRRGAENPPQSESRTDGPSGAANPPEGGPGGPSTT